MMELLLMSSARACSSNPGAECHVSVGKLTQYTKAAAAAFAAAAAQHADTAAAAAGVNIVGRVVGLTSC
jgi:hypothetical protein